MRLHYDEKCLAQLVSEAYNAHESGRRYAGPALAKQVLTSRAGYGANSPPDSLADSVNEMPISVCLRQNSIILDGLFSPRSAVICSLVDQLYWLVRFSIYFIAAFLTSIGETNVS